jgi:copper transport protein
MVGATVLGLMAVTGVLLGWRILGSWANLTGSTYGLLLILKVGLVGVVALVAAWNRLRLVPATQRASGHDATVRATALVRRVVTVEAVALVAVVGLTGFLVDRPPRAAVAAIERGATGTQAALMGEELRVHATLTPGGLGPNTLRLQVQDLTGEPLEAATVPTARLASADLLLGEVALTSVDAGTWEAAVVVPAPGQWQVSVGLRVSDFETPLGLVAFEVR